MKIGEVKEMLYENFMKHGKFGAAMEIAHELEDEEKIKEAGNLAYLKCLENGDLKGAIVYAVGIDKKEKEVKKDLEKFCENEEIIKAILEIYRAAKGKFP